MSLSLMLLTLRVLQHLKHSTLDSTVLLTFCITPYEHTLFEDVMKIEAGASCTIQKIKSRIGQFSFLRVMF